MTGEDTKTDEGQVEDQTAEGAEAADSTDVTTETETKTVPEPSEAEKRLSEQVNDLQGKFDTLSQDATKSKELLDEITPWVDWDGMKAGRTGSEQGENTEEGEQTFLTQKEAKDLEKRLDQKIKTNDFIRDFRTKHPDLGDGGPKEELVRFFFEKEKTGSFDNRMESAVKAARGLLKTEQDKGKAQTEDEKAKAAQEAKTKAEAAAKASGLSSEGITSPKASESTEAETNADYITERKAKTEKMKTMT